ncbi:Enoyl-[acyl-carrier-protein] reductase [NADH] 1, chloroplastic [Capsicum annuum]|nr:Enoyl-[acyl-carrier-protein] reductase [NADH] 1, chloroplastic [Capsicum annuum]KAF3644047.1 Enoyl-[acyl-carrier-protein] reductase [NADH] 1, chloroplastic [Capsicum annuum]
MEEIILDDDGHEKKKNGICVPQNPTSSQLDRASVIFPGIHHDMPRRWSFYSKHCGSILFAAGTWAMDGMFELTEISLAAAAAETIVGTWVQVKFTIRCDKNKCVMLVLLSWTVSEVAESVKEDFGSIDILVHSLANGPEVLAFEAGRKQKVRVNTIAAGPLRSRAAKAIGFIDMMIDYSLANAPLQKELSADEVGNTAAFLASPLASAITGAVIYVDNGLNAMGVGVDSPIFKDLNIPKNTE